MLQNAKSIAASPRLQTGVTLLRQARTRLGHGVLLAVSLAALQALSACSNMPLKTDSTAASEPATTGDTLSATASIFPLERYDQRIDRWIDPKRSDYRSAILPAERQNLEFDRFRRRYFGNAPVDINADKLATNDSATPGNTGSTDKTADAPAASPWDARFVTTENSGLARLAIIARIVNDLHRYGPDGPRTGYGQNLRPYPPAWIAAIAANIDTAAFLQGEAYRSDHRAITTDNVLVRLLPTRDPFFYDSRLPGEGYPFDNLQDSALRPGTPVYILGATRDNAWLYILAPDIAGWVPNQAIGLANDAFVAQWARAAWNSMGAVVSAHVALSDRDGIPRFEAPIGTVLPLVASHTVMVPVLDIARRAQIRYADFTPEDLVPMPYAATPAHFAQLIGALQGRPYGWGGTGLYNDCSLELKSLFTPFGIWLPRHSSAQVEGPGMVDLSSRPTASRIDYLARHGRPFLTLINIPGHVMLYLGNNIVDGQTTPILYEAMWGLSPKDHSRRAIVGQSIILPLLSAFPEDAQLASQAAGATFRLGTLAGDATSPLLDAPESISPDATTPDSR